MDTTQENRRDVPRIVLRRSHTDPASQGKVLPPITAKDWRIFTIGMRGKPASGRVMTFQAVRGTKMWGAWMGGGLLTTAIVLVAMFIGDRQYLPIFLGIGIVIWMIWVTGCWLWLAAVGQQLRDRFVGHVEPGVLVSVDEHGISLDAQTVAWSDLALAEVVLQQDEITDILFRVRLAGALNGVELDTHLIENGSDIVEYVFLQLYPQPMT